MPLEFDAPAGTNLFDDARVVGKSTPRIDGPLKVSGRAPYAYERHDVVANQAYGWIVGASVAKGRITAIELADAQAAPGVIGTISTLDFPPQGLGRLNGLNLFGGNEVVRYHQAIACVVAESFEQARAAAALVRVQYGEADGAYDLAAARDTAEKLDKDGTVGDFAAAFASAAITIDQTYTTPPESHAMMEPHATIAAWQGDALTVWSANQMIGWSQADLGKILGIDPAKVRMVSPFIGGGFGGKLGNCADVVLAALAAREVGRPVKIALHRPLIANNTSHRPATIQRLRLGADADGRITAIAHENWSYKTGEGLSEPAAAQTAVLYAGDNRLIGEYAARLDLPEGNAMRAPGEAVGHLALEAAMDELAEAAGLDPVELRIRNEPATVPGIPGKRFSDRNLTRCLREGAERFGWAERDPTPGARHDGRWLIGMGMAAGYRGAPRIASSARVKLDAQGRITVETDMTDIGTGSYTILAQTAAEAMGVALADVDVVLGDSDFPLAAGSGGQFGAASSTAGVYAACLALRRKVGEQLGFDAEDAEFVDGAIRAGNRHFALADAGAIEAEDKFTIGKFSNDYDIGTYAAHFCELAVDAWTGEVHVRRMLAVCDAGRIINPLSAKSQVSGAMVMAVGMALTEELIVDKRFGMFVNHDLAGYEVPVHADIGEMEVVFLDTLDPISTPLKAKGVGELGICGAGAAIANAFYNATGIRVRDYPITLDKYLAQLPEPG